MANFTFVCSECGATYVERDVRYVCPACARQQQPGGVTRGVLRIELDSIPRRWPSTRLADASSLVAFLPVASPDSLPPVPVGGTPLVAALRLRDKLGMPH